MNEQLIAILVQALTAQMQAHNSGGELPNGMAPSQGQPAPQNANDEHAQAALNRLIAQAQGQPAAPVPEPAAPVPAAPVQADNSQAALLALLQYAASVQTPAAPQVTDAKLPVPVQPTQAQQVIAQAQGQPAAPVPVAPVPASPAVSLANLFAGVNMTGKPVMSMEQISAMTPDQINANWQEVSQALDAATAQ